MSRNFLDQETSPYLLQHRQNPVHWRAWGAAALDEARQQRKPILLSIGYAACHWCHVMAHESFEDPATAQMINSLFLPIKVDREERPDIDAIYQSALSMLGQQGGWPLTMFLTPEAEPFWGGTYFPPAPRFGRPGFREILNRVATVVHEDTPAIRSNVEALRQGLARQSQTDSGGAVSLDLLDQAARAVLPAVDSRYGGLSGNLKFPQMPLFTLLWHAALRCDDPALHDAVTLTLDALCQGGIYDHLGGGFARYATDPQWLVPHFEKMLYDNAQLVTLLTLVWQSGRSGLYRQRVAETIGWLLRDMLAEDGAFAASFDADSEGEEGRYYVWTLAEIDEVLGERTAAFAAAYDVTSAGNWEGQTILRRPLRPAQPLTTAEEDALAADRALLLAHRRQRLPPGRDDKILADWNGMMIAALAQAAFVFRRPDWLAAARGAYDAVRKHLTLENGRLSHCARLGRRQPVAMLDDYAQMADAALRLSQSSGEADFLAQAEAWVAIADAHYWDAVNGGYFFTADDADGLISRGKTAQDHATPSGNGVMVGVLARLFHLTGKDAYRRRAEDTVAAFSGQLHQAFANMSALLTGWELLQAAATIVVVGPPEDPRRETLLRVVADNGSPHLLFLAIAPGQSLPPGHAAFGKGAAEDGGALAYLCRGQRCSLPFTDPIALREALREI